MDKKTNKLHFRRFEFKYFLDEAVAEAIKQDTKHFLVPDPYIEERQGYWVNSIYFDNQDFACFWEKTDGLFFRRKIRFRVYGKNKDSALFLELKRKKGDIILKDRLVVKNRQIDQVLENSLDYLLKRQSNEAEFDLIREYLSTRWRQGLMPVIFIRYFREPLISQYEDLRLTFDENIQATKISEFSFDQDEEKAKELLDKGTVLELKFTGSLPYWLYHLIKKYNLRRQPFSKFCQGMEKVYQECRS